MCCSPTPDPMMCFEVSKERSAKVQESIKKYAKALGTDTLIEVMFEVGYGDTITFDQETRKMQCDLTDLQWVAVAGAMAAVNETKAKQRWNR